MKYKTSRLRIVCLLAVFTWLTGCNLEGADEVEREPIIDTDGDGIADATDSDDDNDGVNDSEDAFPLDQSESIDTDGDGIGDNSDTDDDNDGVDDTLDAFPLDQSETKDTDGDGIGDNSDNDDDNDGVNDADDALPFDSMETEDTDSDGIGNNADKDDDNDGVDDTEDAFPLDQTESVDSDGDGIGNTADNDDDNDGVIDSEDAFPIDDSETADTDGDGIGNNEDNDDDGDGLSDYYLLYDFEQRHVPNDWTLQGDGAENWSITDQQVNYGQYHLQSEEIGHDQSVTLTISVDVEQESISFGFDYKVDSEEDYDLLTFSVNDDIIFDASGETQWLKYSQKLNQGSYKLTWTYSKDSSESEGLDQAWLDNIFFISDNCPLQANPEQNDSDADSIGDACDDDLDNDGYSNDDDAFPQDNTEWLDTDLDGIGNNLDNDDDGDFMPDNFEDLYQQLDSLDPLDAVADLDGDGDSNLSEYNVASNILDSSSKSTESPFQKITTPNQTNVAARYSTAFINYGSELLVAGLDDLEAPRLYRYEVDEQTGKNWQLSDSNNLAYLPYKILRVGDTLIISDHRNSEVDNDSGIVSIYEKDTEDKWQLNNHLYPYSANAKDLFYGSAIAVNDNYLVVGAYGDTLGLDNHRNTGSVYVYKRKNNDWVFHQKLVASDYAPVARFGRSIAINANRIAIGAPHPGYGKVYIFELDASDIWQETSVITAPSGIDGDSFGTTISWQQQSLFISAPSANRSKGAILEYVETENETFEYQQTVQLTEDMNEEHNYRYFSYDILFSGLSLVSRTQNNEDEFQYHIFNRDQFGTWQFNRTLNQPNSIDTSFGFGHSAIDSDNLFIGAVLDNDKGQYAGALYVYKDLPKDDDKDGIVNAFDNCPDIANQDQENGNGGDTGDACDGFSSDSDLQRIVASDGYLDDYFGANFSVEGETMIVGATDNQSAYIFNNESGNWIQQQQIQNNDAAYGFGTGVAIGQDYAMVGTLGISSSVVEVFKYSNESEMWKAHSTIDPQLGASTGFGSEITLWQDYAFISAYRTDESKGALHIYQLVNDVWQALQILEYDEGQSGDFFAISVAVNEHALAVGAAGAGAGIVLVFEQQEDGLWQRIRRVRPSDGEDGDFFGRAIGLWDTTLLVGSPRHNEVGSAYVIDIETWQETKLTSDSPIRFETFGWGVDIEDAVIAVGAINDATNGIASGSTYTFELINGQWQQTNKYVPVSEYSEDNDAFGVKVKLSNGELFMGMDTEDGYNRGAIYIKNLN